MVARRHARLRLEEGVVDQVQGDEGQGRLRQPGLRRHPRPRLSERARDLLVGDLGHDAGTGGGAAMFIAGFWFAASWVTRVVIGCSSRPCR